MRSLRARYLSPALGGLVLICVTVLFSSPANAQEDGSFGFYRTVVGDVRLTTADRAEPIDVEPDYPLLLGDRLWVAPGALAEAILPDQTILRAGGSTDLYFEELALYAAEQDTAGSVLRLLEGEVQVVLRESGWEGEPVRVDTANAVIYLERSGSYRIYADDQRWTELVVREGFAEVVLGDGSVVVRANEEIVVDGVSEPRVRVYAAGALDALETWGDELDRDARLAATGGHVDDALSYAAAPLERHGEWVHVDDHYVWRPYAAAGWRPYTVGHWTHTPAGYYWVSADPWGGFTYHYGSWRLHPYHGWIWYPGSVFSPAWVTWYWGPTHVGWVPAGYYSHHYRPYGYLTVGLGYGHYGWAGGSWGYYSDWTFCPTRYFGWRSYRSYWRTGHEIARTAQHDVPRGVITATTRTIPRTLANRPESLLEHLRGGSNSKLPDVTGFVARKPDLSPEVREAVFAKPGSSRSLAGRLTADRPARNGSSRVTAIERSGTREPESVVRSLPARPDLSRREIATGEPVTRAPQPRLPRGVERGSGIRVEPPARDTGTERRAPSNLLAPRAPVGADSPGDTRSPSSVLRRTPSSTRDAAPSATPSGPRVSSPPASARPSAPLPPSAREAPPAGRTKVPIVRRILDGIRGAPSTPPASAPRTAPPVSSRPSVAPPSARPAPPTSSGPSVAPPSSRPTPPTTSRPSASPPSSSRSKPPTSSRPSVSPPSSSRSSSPPPSVSRRPASRPTASRPSPSSSGSARKPSASSRSSSSSSKSSRSSAKPRSQSPPKSNPTR